MFKSYVNSFSVVNLMYLCQQVFYHNTLTEAGKNIGVNYAESIKEEFQSVFYKIDRIRRLNKNVFKIENGLA
jgi:hypothetical protein